jgi:ferredoxin
MKKRGFLKRLVYLSALIGSALMPFAIFRSATPAAPVNPRQHLRPPGAIKDDDAFVAACIGCGLCGEVCPPRCIKFHRRDGGLQANTPYINPEEKACILCNKCMEVCPTEALTETPRNQIDMGFAQIDRTACYPWVDQGVCGACVNICPVGEDAIGFKLWNQYRPVVRDGCVGCGVCVEVCPHPSLPIWIVDRPNNLLMENPA